MKLSDGCAEPLGATATPDGVNFAVWSGHASHIEVCLYDDHDQETCRLILPERTGQVFHGHVAELQIGQRYGLRAHGPWAPQEGHRFTPDKLLLDPMALAIDRPFSLDEAMLADHPADSASAMPKGVVVAPVDAPAPPKVAWRDMVIYEMHVRGFTKRMPGVPEDLRGTFAGMAHPAALAHLKRLGVTTVELLPCMAWIDEPHLKRKGLSNYWGYNPIAWCAPDPRLAPGGWAEIRQAVAELGRAGIEVILDVVYNHSGEGDELGPTVSLRGLDNSGYYRLADDRSLYVNDAGTGNILDAEQPAVVRLVMDSLRAWARFGGVAGFRFDLATTLGRRREGFDPQAPLLAAMAQDPILRKLKMIMEPWDCGPGGYQLGAFPAPWAEWNDRYRDEVRRFWRGDGVALGHLAHRLCGSQDDLGGRPVSTSVNFVTAHDGFTLHDLVSYDRKHNAANGEDNRDGTGENYAWISDDPARDQRNLLAALMVSRGTPMIAMGSEIGQSQAGNNNAYAQDNAISWLDWESADAGLTAFCARLIAARRDHPALRGDWLTGNVTSGDWPDVSWSRADGEPLGPGDWDAPLGSLLVMTLCEDEDRVCVILHRGQEPIACRLPATDWGRAWNLIVDTADDNRQGNVAGEIAVAARSVIILAEVSRRDRATGVDDALVAGLCSAAGIEAHWWSVDGVRTDVPRESRLHLLSALGLPSDTSGDARLALRQLADEMDRRALPWAHVHHGEGPVTLRLAAPTAAPPPRTWLHIRDETGKVSRLATRAMDSRRTLGRDGRPFLTYGLNLGPMAPGRYSVWREDASDVVCSLTVAPQSAWQAESPAPRFGVTAQIYAARRAGDGGIGDFTTLAELMDRAGQAGAALVGVNPLHALFPGDRDRASPYFPSDRRFLDPIYLDTGEAHDDGPVIDYPAVWARKDAVLRARFALEKSNADFAEFVADAGDALCAFAAFEAGKTGDPLYVLYLQWLCDNQLADAVARGQAAGVGLYRDLAIGAAPGGAEGTTLAHLIAQGVSLGAPPDPFTRDGQVWGIPPLSPFALNRDGYKSIAGIYRANMRHAQALRIDHAIGLMRQFWVPEGADGKDGAYIRFPCDDLIGQLTLESVRARCLIVGEDLGTVPEGFRERMHDAGVLSYKVMPFEREGLAFRPPSAYPSDALACASTHDLPPLAGWWSGSEIRERSALGLVDDAALGVRRQEKVELLAALTRAGVLGATEPDGPLTLEIASAVHAFVAASPARLAMVQLEDLAAMDLPVNLPGTDRERPNWRHRLPLTVSDVMCSPWAKSLLDAISKGRA